MGMTVTDKMLALRAEIHHEHEFMTIYIGDFNVRQAEKMANNKLDGHIVRSTKREGKANVCRRPGILLSPFLVLTMSNLLLKDERMHTSCDSLTMCHSG